MNKRIQELASKVGIHYYRKGQLQVDTENLVELIIQRTLDIVEAHTEIFQSDEARVMVEHIKQSVKTDFGIKNETKS
jgi:hypothetical protein